MKLCCIVSVTSELRRLHTVSYASVVFGGVVLSTGETVSVASDGCMHVADITDGSTLADIPVTPGRPLRAVAATHDDNMLVTVGDDAIVRVMQSDVANKP